MRVGILAGGESKRLGGKLFLNVRGHTVLESAVRYAKRYTGEVNIYTSPEYDEPIRHFIKEGVKIVSRVRKGMIEEIQEAGLIHVWICGDNYFSRNTPLLRAGEALSTVSWNRELDWFNFSQQKWCTRELRDNVPYPSLMGAWRWRDASNVKLSFPSLVEILNHNSVYPRIVDGGVHDCGTIDSYKDALKSLHNEDPDF